MVQNTATGEDIKQINTATREDITEINTATGEDIKQIKTATGEDITQINTATGEDITQINTATGGDITQIKENMRLTGWVFIMTKVDVPFPKSKFTEFWTLQLRWIRGNIRNTRSPLST